MCIDGRDDYDATEWVEGKRDALDRIAQRSRSVANASVVVEIVAPGICYGEHVIRRAFVDAEGASSSGPAKKLFKNTLAYFWGLARCAEYARYAAHLDDDMHMVSDLASAATRVDVVPRGSSSLEDMVPVARRMEGSAGADWVEVGVGLLKDDARLLSVHPTPWHPSPFGAHWSKQHEATTERKFLVTYRPSHGPPLASHFSFQAFVVDSQRFVDTWPMADKHRQVEMLVEDAALNAGLFSAFAPPSVLGCVKSQVANTEELFERCASQNYWVTDDGALKCDPASWPRDLHRVFF